MLAARRPAAASSITAIEATNTFDPLTERLADASNSTASRDRRGPRVPAHEEHRVPCSTLSSG